MAEPDAFDQLFAAEAARTEIVPSSGFTAAVMGAIRQTASAPAPIPFPWTRAWPLLVAAAVALGTLLTSVWQAIGTASSSDTTLPGLGPIDPGVLAAWGVAGMWTLFGLLVALASFVAALQAGEWLHRARRQ